MEADSAGYERPFVCDFCPKKYLRKNNLQDHVLMEHPDSEQALDIMAHKARNGRSKASLIIKCDICSKKFRYQSDMKNHYESHFRPRTRGNRSSVNGEIPSPHQLKRIPPKMLFGASKSVEHFPLSRDRSHSFHDENSPQKLNSRTCRYCGKKISDRNELKMHEYLEVKELERQSMRSEFTRRRNRVNGLDFESSSQNLHQVIDRTDEEFGDDFDQEAPNSRLDESVAGSVRSSSISRNAESGLAVVPIQQPIPNHGQMNGTSFPPSVTSHHQSPQFNHTSQYTLFDPGFPNKVTEPPPAHEDQISVHGFLPPPPPLPFPQFSQGCHKRSDIEFPDPNEERTYIQLQSKDESQTRSSLLHVNSMSPSREVLDLSIPKTYSNSEEVEYEPFVNSSADVAKSEISTENFEGDTKVDTDEIVSFEPNAMPSMPEANISAIEVQNDIREEEQELNGLSEEEWKAFADEYSGLVTGDDDAESNRSVSPSQIDEDPNRIDCRFCGMIFDAPHVRKFHEASHEEEHEEYDGEETRLFCGFCAKVFKKAKYRMLHEKAHMGELTIGCNYCDRKFRWESELKAHNRLFCTAEHPAKNKKHGNSISNRHRDKSDWSTHSSLPIGWKLRSRPRPNQEGQVYFIFLSPEGQVFHSRRAVLQHMEATGGYSVEDIKKMRENCKTGPRGRRGRNRGSGGTDNLDLDTSNSYLDMNDSSNLDSTKDSYIKESQSEEIEGLGSAWSCEDLGLPIGWKVRKLGNQHQFLSPENTLLETPREVINYIRKSNRQDEEEDEDTEVRTEQPKKENWSSNVKTVDMKFKQFRKKVPRRKRLVSNQVIVTTKIKFLRRQTISEESILSNNSFDRDVVIFVPRLQYFIKDFPHSQLKNKEIDASEVDISVDDISAVEEGTIMGNIMEIKKELKDRQIDFDSKLSDDEEEDSGQRSLRFRHRQNYEEAPLEEDIVGRFTQKLEKVVSYEDCDEDDLTDSDPNSKNNFLQNGRDRIRFTTDEIKVLDARFDLNPYPKKLERQEISKLLKVPFKNVGIWFQNKRHKTDDGKMKCFFVRNNISDSPTSEKTKKVEHCYPCSQTFCSRWDFKVHCRRVHGVVDEDDTKLKCRECGILSDSKWNLKTHMIETHSKAGNETEGSAEDAYDDHMGGRTKFTKFQIVGLRNAFSTNPYPGKEEYRVLADKLNLTSKTLHSWFQNNRHREKIHSKITNGDGESLDFTDPNLDYYDDDSKPLYNPGHKKTKFNDHQRNYLQSFFMAKEYVDEEDISDLSTELMLPPKVIRIWFQHARDRKKKNVPLSLATRGRGRGRVNLRGRSLTTGRPRGRPPKTKAPDIEEDYFGMDDDSMSNEGPTKTNPTKPIVAGKSKTDLDGGKSGFGSDKLTEFQKVFLEDFYADITDPDSDCLDYLCDHINASREKISNWFVEKKHKLNYLRSEKIKLVSSIIDDLIDNLDSYCSSKKNMLEILDQFTCPYCGKLFRDEVMLREHERLEAIEFEKEATKIREQDLNISCGGFVTLDNTLNELLADSYEDTEFPSGEEDEDEDEYFCSSDALFGDEGDFNMLPIDDRFQRPPNPFMVWVQEERKRWQGDQYDKPNREMVKELAIVWKRMSDEDKMPYIEESRRLKQKFLSENPGYQFQSNMRQFKSPSHHYSKSKRTQLIKDFLCKRCNVGFTTKGNLFKHLRNFHPESPYDSKYYELPTEKVGGEKIPMKCQYCQQEFVSKVGLAKHIQKQHSNQDRGSNFITTARKLDFSDYDEESTGFDTFRSYYEPDEEPVAGNRSCSNGFSYTEPVSSSSDKLYSDDDYSTEKRAHVKTRFTDYQRKVLLENFQRSITMSKCDAKQLYFTLADELRLPSKIVRIWFQNARSARKRGKPIFSR